MLDRFVCVTINRTILPPTPIWDKPLEGKRKFMSLAEMVNEYDYHEPSERHTKIQVPSAALQMLSVALADPLRRKVYPAFCEGLAVIGRPLLLSGAEDVTSRAASRSCVV